MAYFFFCSSELNVGVDPGEFYLCLRHRFEEEEKVSNHIWVCCFDNLNNRLLAQNLSFSRKISEVRDGSPYQIDIIQSGPKIVRYELMFVVT